MGKKTDFPKDSIVVFTDKWINNNKHNKRFNPEEEFLVVGWGRDETVRVKKDGQNSTKSYHVTFLKLKE